MPAFVAAIWGALYLMIGSLVGRAVIALGLGVISYTGLSITMGWLKGQFLANALALPSDVVGMMAVMRVGESVNIVFSALLVRLLLNGMSSDTVKRWVIK